MNSQRAIVAASLQADEQRLHRHDAPARRTQVVPGELRMPDVSAFEPTRDHASRTTNAGHDGGSAAPSSIPHLIAGGRRIA